MTGLIYWLFIFALVFAPLAFGTVEEWSLAVMETAALVAFGLYLSGGRAKKPSYAIPGIVPLLLLLAFVCLQCVPLPSTLVRLISPGAASLYNTAGAGGPAAWHPLSVNVKGTVTEFFRLASYIAFYALTVQLLSRRELLKRTVSLIAIFASLLSLLAVLQRALSNNRIFWIREVTIGTPFGPYVNPDHFAGLMEMMFPVVLGLFLFYKPAVSYGTLRERIAGIFDQGAANVHILLGLSSVLTATSIFLTLSRGGVVSLCISMAFMGGMLMMKERKSGSGRGALIAVVFIVILLSVGWFGWGPLVQKFGRTAAENNMSDMRFAIWKDSLGLMKDFPFAGAGFGNFVRIYPVYRSLSDPVLVEHAHNDYIELLAEGGIAGIALVIWFLAEVLVKSWKVFRTRREHYSVYIFAGAAAGIVSILLHSLVDFNLQIGANGLWFFFLAGLAVSAANTRLREGAGETLLGKTDPRFARPLHAVSLVIPVLCLVFNSGMLIGKISFADAGQIYGGQTPKEEIGRIRDRSLRAALFDPLEAGYYYSAAGAEWRLGDRARALRDYRTSVRLDPANGEYTQMLGLLIGDSGKDGEADALLRTGIGLDRHNPGVYRRYASWLFARGRKQEGAAIVRRAISLEPRNTRDYITMMVLYRLDDAGIRNAVPDLAEPRLLLAEYLSGTGNDTMADVEYRNALDCARRGKTPGPSFFESIYRYYDGRGMRDAALAVMSTAAEMLPEDEGILLAAGDAYEKAGITYRAAEEYRKALVIDPKSGIARKKLGLLGQ